MLTDSRSFPELHPPCELFRRLMCNLIGNWVEGTASIPTTRRLLKKIVEGIGYYNAKRYF